MIPQMQPTVPPHIKAVVDRLLELEDPVGRDAAAVITALVAAAEPEMVTVCLSTNTVRRGGVTVKLSPNQAVLMDLLVESGASLVSRDAMHRALWGAQGDRHSINTVRVMLTELRRRLVPIRVAIQNSHSRGYRLELQPIT